MNAFWASVNFDAFIAFRSLLPAEGNTRKTLIQNEGVFGERINMNGAFYVAATGLRSQEQAIEVAANNITNWNTPGYKRVRAHFSDLVVTPATANMTQDAKASATASLGGGVRIDQIGRDMRTGELRETGNALDLAVDGKGFIEVLDASGEVFLWRGGQLKIDADGHLATHEGHVLKSILQIPDETSALSIDRTGVVSGLVGGKAQQIGRIDLAVARDESSLEAIGGGLYRSTRPEELVNATPGEDGAGALAQGFEEGSNVQLAEEMIALMLTQRAFAANSQVVQAADQLMSISNNIRR
jgi:flagellar basal-body rod protein FlgG